MGIAFKLNGGMLFLSTEAPGGVYNGTQLKKVAQLADSDSLVIKVTEDQRLGLFVPLSKVPKIATELKTVGLGIRHYQDGLHQPVNCAGEFCPENSQDAMGTSIELTKELTKLGPLASPLKMGINGCGRCCVPTHTLDISIIGEPGGYRVSLGGKNSQIPEMASFMAEGVPAAMVPSLVSKIVELYRKLAQKDETLQEVMERCGTTAFVKVLAPYSQDAHQSGVDEEDTSLLGEEPSDPLIGAEVSSESEPEVGDLVAEGNSTGIPQIDAMDSIDDVDGLQEPAVGPADFGEDLAIQDEDLKLETNSLEMTNEEPLAAEESLVAEDALAEETLTPEDSLVGEEFSEEALGVEEPLTEEPLAEEPLAEEPLAEEPLAEEPLAEDAFAEDSFTEVPLAQEAILDEELAEEPLLEDSSLEDSSLEDSSLEEPLLEEPLVSENSAVEDSQQVSESLKGLESSVPPHEQGSSDSEFDEGAEEVSDADADEFEQKIVASIAEEEAVPELDDSNHEDREDAMNLVEVTGAAPSEEALQDSLNPPSDFSNLDIESIESGDLEPELMEDEVTGPDTFVPETAEMENDQRVGVPSRPALVRAPPLTSGSVTPQIPRALPLSSATFEVEGVDLDNNGRINLFLTSGAKFSFDTKTFKVGRVQKLKLGGLSIEVSKDSNGVYIEVDGLAMHLPIDNAA